MEKMIVIVAMLLNIETNEVEPKTHQFYNFQELDHCMSFVTQNYQGLYIGLTDYLNQEGKTNMKIVEIGCAELTEEEQEKLFPRPPSGKEISA
tara:strand:+ start:175 stop:453 length:279 start_codon:yes stop_codon:yes gene_type:complete